MSVASGSTFEDFEMDTHIDDKIWCCSEQPGWRILTRDFRALGQTVRAGSRWDGASTPAAFRWLIPKFHKCLKASCLHDWRCKNATSAEERAEADREFQYMLTHAEEMGGFRAWLGWAGVRVGAWWGTGVNYPHWIKDNVWPVFGVR